MHAVELIAQALTEWEPLPCEPIAGICAVTGKEGPCIPRKELFTKSFTNLDLLAAPDSDMLGVAAWKALTHKWERMSLWFCDGVEFYRLDRQCVREIVLCGHYPERWAAYATTSYKKHGSLWTKVNTAGRAVWRFEMLDVDCSDRKKLMEIWDRLNLELRGGLGRSNLETLDCPPFVLKMTGVSRWMYFEKWAKPHYQGALYQFLCYLLPSQEELKIERAG